VMAQRLVRRLCAVCAAPGGAPVGESGGSWRSPVGCRNCQHTGYRGRQGIYELVTVDEALRHAVASLAPAGEIERIANARGRRSLREDGMIKARRGETSVEEVIRVAGADLA
ncbi:MAG: type II/IV secretion system protein, partial [Gammaproteobacteria bacterium]